MSGTDDVRYRPGSAVVQVRVPTFEELDLEHKPNAVQTYIGSDADECWIGPKWDVARRGPYWDLYRKGNFITTVHHPEVALLIVADEMLWFGQGVDSGRSDR